MEQFYPKRAQFSESVLSHKEYAEAQEHSYKEMKLPTYEEFAQAAKEDYIRSYLGKHTTLAGISRFFDKEDTKLGIRSAYEDFAQDVGNGILEKGHIKTIPRYMQACISSLVYCMRFEFDEFD